MSNTFSLKFKKHVQALGEIDMTAYDRLKSLCDKQGISVNVLEERIGIGKNVLYSWKKKVPGGTNLQLVADYFDVSTDYLLGRTDNPDSNKNKEDDEYSDLVMMFRKNEMEIPEEKRDEYRKEVEKLMDFVKYTMKELDEKNKKKKNK